MIELALVANLSGRPATPSEIEAKVFDLAPDVAAEAKLLLSVFHGLPTRHDIQLRANVLADIAVETGAFGAMIDGPSFMLAALEAALLQREISVFYPLTVGNLTRFVAVNP